MSNLIWIVSQGDIALQYLGQVPTIKYTSIFWYADHECCNESWWQSPVWATERIKFHWFLKKSIIFRSRYLPLLLSITYIKKIIPSYAAARVKKLLFVFVFKGLRVKPIFFIKNIAIGQEHRPYTYFLPYLGRGLKNTSCICYSGSKTIYLVFFTYYAVKRGKSNLFFIKKIVIV